MTQEAYTYSNEEAAHTLASHAVDPHQSTIQHHFENAEQQKDASTVGMWVFLLTEVMFFGGLFLAYFVYRQWYPAAFAAASNNTNLLIGAGNTTVLISQQFDDGAGGFARPRSENRIWYILFLVLTLLLGGNVPGRQGI